MTGRQTSLTWKVTRERNDKRRSSVVPPGDWVQDPEDAQSPV